MLLNDMAMPNWKDLGDAYGSAEDLPDLLAELEPDPRSPVWPELWGRVCHQSSTFSASPHVLPFLLKAASAWEPGSRAMPLALAGSIVAAPETVLDSYRSILEELRLLALDTLKSGELSRQDRIYVMQSALAFEGDRLWGHALDRLNDGEFSGVCPACQTDLCFVIGQYGVFCAVQNWVRNTGAPRSDVHAVAADQLSGVGRRLHGLSVESGDSVLAEWICYVFGVSSCPNCGHPLPVADVIAAAEAPWMRLPPQEGR
jgi:hypothetical protein